MGTQERKGTQEELRSAKALRDALEAKGMTQADLARELHIDPGQVSRWVHGKAVPQGQNLRRIAEILGVDLSEYLMAATPAYELFVSAPVSGIAREEVAGHHNAVAQVVEAARQHVNGLIWPGGRNRDAADVQTVAADIAAEQNMIALFGCQAYLYLQFAEVMRPSSALVELGFALGTKKNVTIIIQRELTNPYLLRGFGSVANKLKFLPAARSYEVASPDEAAALIKENGRVLLGLAELLPVRR
jgi:transcriptional regulator with XRE-family HTH domain